MKKGDAIDPKGLIGEAYKIEGITEPECRSIFLDWALAVDASVDSAALIAVLLDRRCCRRRGGRRGRLTP